MQKVLEETLPATLSQLGIPSSNLGGNATTMMSRLSIPSPSVEQIGELPRDVACPTASNAGQFTSTTTNPARSSIGNGNGLNDIGIPWNASQRPSRTRRTRGPSRPSKNGPRATTNTTADTELLTNQGNTNPPSIVAQLQQVHGLTKKKLYGSANHHGFSQTPFFKEDEVEGYKHPSSDSKATRETMNMRPHRRKNSRQKMEQPTHSQQSLLRHSPYSTPSSHPHQIHYSHHYPFPLAHWKHDDTDIDVHHANNMNIISYPGRSIMEDCSLGSHYNLMLAHKDERPGHFIPQSSVPPFDIYSQHQNDTSPLYFQEPIQVRHGGPNSNITPSLITTSAPTSSDFQDINATDPGIPHTHAHPYPHAQPHSSNYTPAPAYPYQVSQSYISSLPSGSGSSLMTSQHQPTPIGNILPYDDPNPTLYPNFHNFYTNINSNSNLNPNTEVDININISNTRTSTSPTISSTRSSSQTSDTIQIPIPIPIPINNHNILSVNMGQSESLEFVHQSTQNQVVLSGSGGFTENPNIDIEVPTSTGVSDYGQGFHHHTSSSLSAMLYLHPNTHYLIQDRDRGDLET